MQVFRFDPAIAVPVEDQGWVAPLAGDDSRVRVDVVYLRAGGVIIRGGDPERELFAVVAGRGWASGRDGHRRDLKTGYAASWDENEVRQAGSDLGLTAVRVCGVFDVWAMGVTREIRVVPYDPAWPRWFEQLRERIWPAVADIALRIEHIGSTSVPGLAAKPIIDLDIVVPSPEQVGRAIERLGQAGYRWRGDLGVPGRESFKLLQPEPGLPDHHLYLVVEDSKPHVDHWLLRDVLRTDADLRREYAALKRRNADLAGDDMDVYVEAKAAFVTEVLTHARDKRRLTEPT